LGVPPDHAPPRSSDAPAAVSGLTRGKPVRGRSPGGIAWMRLCRDKVAMTSGGFIVFLLLIAVIGPHLVQNPDTYHPNLINPTFSRPSQSWPSTCSATGCVTRSTRKAAN
jgi:hypothetical protein